MTEDQAGSEVEEAAGDEPAESKATGDAGSAPESDAAPEGHKRPWFMRRLYDWVLHWADTPYGMPALFLLSMAESSFFPIPPDPLLVGLALGARKKALKFAAVATGASVIGGIIGYGIGAGAWSLVGDWFYQYVPGVDAEHFGKIQGWYARWDFWAVFFAGLTPMPYKVITLSAGVFAINFPVFVVASVVSRGLRFFLVAGLIYKFGPPIARFIDKYFDLLAVVFSVLLIGGFAVIKWVL